MWILFIYFIRNIFHLCLWYISISRRHLINSRLYKTANNVNVFYSHFRFLYLVTLFYLLNIIIYFYVLFLFSFLYFSQTRINSKWQKRIEHDLISYVLGRRTRENEMIYWSYCCWCRRHPSPTVLEINFKKFLHFFYFFFSFFMYNINLN